MPSVAPAAPPADPAASPALISAGLHLSRGKASIFGPSLSDPASRAAAATALHFTIGILGDPRLPSHQARADALLRGDGSTIASGHPVLGTPIGTDAFVESTVAASADAALRLIAILDRLLLCSDPASPNCFAPDERDLLIRFCVWPRLRHFLRTVRPGLCSDTFADFDAAIARARFAVIPTDSSTVHIDPVALAALPGRFGGHGVMPHSSVAGEASFHDAAFYGAFAAVWHYMRSWIPALRGRQLAHTGAGEGFPYQQHVATAFDRIHRAHTAVGLDPQRDSLLPADARFPELHTGLDDGGFSAATVPLGHTAGGLASDDADDSPSLLFDLDCLDVACHPHAQRAASAVVASRSFLALYHSRDTTPTGRARLLDGSVSRGPFSFWRRLPDTDPSLPHEPFFAFADPEHFPIALALDVLLRPPVPGDSSGTEVICTMCHPPPHAATPPTILPGARHFVPCPHGMRLHTICHDPAVQALVPFLDAVLGPACVTAERGGQGGHAAMDAWMQGPGAGLPKPPDIVLTDFDGPRSYTLIDVKSLDAAGASHIASDHTDSSRLAAHRAATRRCVHTEYGPLPPRMRLVVLAVSTFGAIDRPGQALISELSRRTRGTVPPSLLPHASWAVPRLGPMVRMALTLAVRRGLAASVHSHWRRGSFVVVDAAEEGGEGGEGGGEEGGERGERRERREGGEGEGGGRGEGEGGGKDGRDEGVGGGSGAVA